MQQGQMKTFIARNRRKREGDLDSPLTSDCLLLQPSEKVLNLGIFKRGVMAGALALMMLNRLQMLKESRGQECKRPDGERERERERERRGENEEGKSQRETPLAPTRTPRGT